MSHWTNSSKEYDKERISLGFNGDIDKEDAYLQWISEPEEYKPGILSLSNTLQIVVICAMLLFVFIGTYFKFVLYMCIRLRYTLKEQGPIDMLILTSSIIQHATNLLNVFHYIMMVLNDTTLQNVLGHWYCFSLIHIMAFDIIYLVVGSFGLSLFRILYILKHNWVKDVVGEKKLMKTILFGGILLSGSMVVVQSNHSIYQEILHQNCAHPQETFVNIVISFTQSRGKPIMFSTWYQKGVAFVLLLMTVGEIGSYVIFFHHVYKHDNQGKYRYLLGSAVIQARNRKNATTFLGQFISFLTELCLLITGVVLFDIGNYFHILRSMFPIFRTMCFSVMSIVEVLSSYQLRGRIFKPWDSML